MWELNVCLHDGVCKRVVVWGVHFLTIKYGYLPSRGDTQKN